MLVDMPALGDRKTTQLLAAMVEACPRGQENSVFMSALFLRKLPADVRILLAHMDHTRLKEMATAADQLVAMLAAPAAVAAVEADPGEVAAVAARGGGTGVGRKPAAAAAAKQKKKKPLEEPEPSKAARQAAGLCLRHWRIYLHIICTLNRRSLQYTIKIRVVDLYSLFPDPDPEYDIGDQYGSGSKIRIRIRILLQYGSRALITKN